jgi:hypothetical protein
LLAAGRTQWVVGERARIYCGSGGAPVWLPDPEDTAESFAADSRDPRKYDSVYDVDLLLNVYAGRLRKAYSSESFAQLFRLDDQPSLFDEQLDQIEPLWIR